MGNIFYIIEKPFISMMHERLSKLDLESVRADFMKKSRDRMMNPKPARNLPKSLDSNFHTYDPTYILDRDITMPDGTVIYKKYHKINPLDFMDFDRKLYFIDQRDNEQIDWLKVELADSDESKVKYVILTGGSPAKLEELLDREIYFDQFGELISKFKIMAVPSIVEQKGGDKFLTISEIGM
jgi:conjugal transfer pilus assembly protein TraW